MPDHLTQRVLPLVLTFTLSMLIAALLHPSFSAEASPPQVKLQGKATVTDTGGAYHDFYRNYGYGVPAPLRGESRSGATPYRITFQPKALYTDTARANNVQGSVRLKIVLLGNGSVGLITKVTELPDGLTEQAVAAARQIRFEPRKVNGHPVSVV